MGSFEHLCASLLVTLLVIVTKNPNKKLLRGEIFVLAHDLRAQSTMVRKALRSRGGQDSL